jgi:hypothetical protein
MGYKKKKKKKKKILHAEEKKARLEWSSFVFTVTTLFRIRVTLYTIKLDRHFRI